MARTERTPKSKNIIVLDCGCVITRPRKSRLYGARWRAYKAPYSIILKCLDCGKSTTYALYRDQKQTTSFDSDYLTLNADKAYEQKLNADGGNRT